MSLRAHMTLEEQRIIDNFLSQNGGTEGMERLPTREIRKKLSEVLMRAKFGGEGLVVTHHGKERCAIVPIEISEIIQKVKARAEQN